MKLRTLTTNYASFYAVLWKLHSTFGTVWTERGYSWQGMMEWMEKVHVPFLMQQHRERDHAKHSIRRYVNELLLFTEDWTVLERRKLMKLCETSKLRNSDKYCLAFHPSQAYRNLQELGGVRLKDLKDQTNAIGGAWGSDSWACLVRDDVESDFETTQNNSPESGLDQTKSKRALLIPVSVFTSSQIMKICDSLGQNEDYKRFGADEETPSGVEDDGYRNSTQVPGSQAMTINMSRINNTPEEEFEFDNLETLRSFQDSNTRYKHKL